MIIPCVNCIVTKPFLWYCLPKMSWQIKTILCRIKLFPNHLLKYLFLLILSTRIPFHLPPTYLDHINSSQFNKTWYNTIYYLIYKSYFNALLVISEILILDETDTDQWDHYYRIKVKIRRTWIMATAMNETGKERWSVILWGAHNCSDLVTDWI